MFYCYYATIIMVNKDIGYIKRIRCHAKRFLRAPAIGHVVVDGRGGQSSYITIASVAYDINYPRIY